MAVQQTVRVIGASNNTIAQVTTDADAMLVTPEACSLQSSQSVGAILANAVNATTDQVVLSLRWEDSFTEGFVKRIRAGFNSNVAGTAGVYTFKLFRVTNFFNQYNNINSSNGDASNVTIPFLRSGQSYQGLVTSSNSSGSLSGSLVTAGSGALITSGLGGAVNVVDPNPLAAVAISKRAVAGQGPGFNTGGFAGNIGMASLWEVSEGDYPIYLQKGEGIIVTTTTQTTTNLGAVISLAFDAVPIINQEY